MKFCLASIVSITILVCIFFDPSSTESSININKPDEGHSTASDTLLKEDLTIKLDGFSADELKAIRENAEKHHFQAEVDRMMKLIVNSLYKNKEVFLRELTSNAADALDKVRILSLTDSNIDSTDLKVLVKVDDKSKTLHIIDNGIGMSKSELEANLGTIAKSGTSDFVKKLAESKSSSETSDLIGQFGVGFYSAFLVASKVMVISKSETDDQYIWESDSNSYTVYKDPRGNTLKRGTEIILYLTDEASDYLKLNNIKDVLKKYSQFINFPLFLWDKHIEQVAAEPDEQETPKDDASVEEEKKTEPKMVDKETWKWTLINENKPIWKRKPSEVTEKEYTDLYKALSRDYDDPLTKIHFRMEGGIVFSAVIFVPKRSPTNIFHSHESYNDRLKLYVRRVFISDMGDKLLPRYLAFIMGIVDNDEFSLNVSRETLQDSKLINMMKEKLVRKVLDAISKLPKEDFDKFWQQYSSNIKMGIIEDKHNHNKLAKLLRFYTSKSTDKQTTLDDYVSSMKENQKEIYYLTGSSLDEVKKSLFSESLIKKGYEVIYMIDPLDEYMVQSLSTYNDKPLKNVAKEGLEIDQTEESKETKEKLKKEFEPLSRWLVEQVLKNDIEKVEISERLSQSPCALVASQYGWSGNMERIMTAQANHKSDDPSSSYFGSLKKIFEINPRHPVIKEMKARVEADVNDSEAKETALLLFDVATIRSGYVIKNPVEFANRIEFVMRKNLKVDLHEKVEEEEEDNSHTDPFKHKVETDEETEDNQRTESKDEL